MKKIVCVYLIFIFFYMANGISYCSNAENSVDTSGIIEQQSTSLGISDFIDSAEKYSTDLLDDVKIKDILADAITGKIDNSSLGKKILEKFFKEVLSSCVVIRKYNDNNSNSQYFKKYFRWVRK